MDETRHSRLALIVTLIAFGACSTSEQERDAVSEHDAGRVDVASSRDRGSGNPAPLATNAPGSSTPESAVQPLAPDLPRRVDPVVPDLDHRGLGVSMLNGQVFYESEDLGLPTLIASVGSTLVGVDQAADTLFFVLDGITGRLIRKFGRRGSGPGEFRSIYTLDPVHRDSSTLWVYDVQLRRMTRVDVDAGARAEEHVKKSIPLQVTSTIASAVWIRGLIAATGFYPQGRLAFIDSTGSIVRVTGSLPPGNERTPANVRQHAYQGTLVTSPSRHRLAVVTRHLGQIEIYSRDGELVQIASGPYTFAPRYQVTRSSAGDVMASDVDLRFGYIAAAATEDAILALFSGRTRAGHPGAATFGEYVHVFDWEGNLRRVFKLSDVGIGMAIDEARRTLYVVRHDPTPAVMRYDLPRTLF